MNKIIAHQDLVDNLSNSLDIYYSYKKTLVKKLVLKRVSQETYIVITKLHTGMQDYSFISNSKPIRLRGHFTINEIIKENRKKKL